MVLIGRLTKDAIVSTLKDNRKVVNFTVAVNDGYTPKGSDERKSYASFFHCAYWISTAIAPLLLKGCIVEVSGRIYVRAYKDMEETAKATLHCHAGAIKIHQRMNAEDAPKEKAADELPF